MTAPIRPNQVKHKIPDYIIDSVNQLIEENYVGTQSFSLKKCDIIEKCFKHPEQTKFISFDAFEQEMYDKHYLDFESIYRKADWLVEYETPDRGDHDFEPYYKFTSNL